MAPIIPPPKEITVMEDSTVLTPHYPEGKSMSSKKTSVVLTIESLIAAVFVCLSVTPSAVAQRHLTAEQYEDEIRKTQHEIIKLENELAAEFGSAVVIHIITGGWGEWVEWIRNCYHGAKAPELIDKARLLWYDSQTYYQQEWTALCRYYPHECFRFQQDPVARAYNQRQEQLKRQGIGQKAACQTPLPSNQGKCPPDMISEQIGDFTWCRHPKGWTRR
jgi:hypothetical protein